MKILQLTKKFPYPLKDGESIAITYLAQALHDLGAEVTLLSMNTSKHYFDIATLPTDFDHYAARHLVEVDNRVKIGDALLNLFSSDSYHIARFISSDFEAKLADLLQQNSYDIIQLETLYLAPYVPIIRQYSTAKIVMRSHNVEYEIWKRITENTNLGAKKAYLSLLTKRLRDFELKSLNTYDLLVAITQRDLDFFAQKNCAIPTHVTPIGLELAQYISTPYSASPAVTFCFIGSLDWMPNIEGVEWVLANVWDQVLAQVPTATFHVAGRNCPEQLLQQQHQNVVIHGEVEDALTFINAYDVMLVPLFSGSGMRVKILEGMALQKTVISTSLGLEGIAAAHQQEVLIADQAKDFVSEMVALAANEKQLEYIGKNAREFIQKEFDNRAIAAELLQQYEALLLQ